MWGSAVRTSAMSSTNFKHPCQLNCIMRFTSKVLNPDPFSKKNPQMGLKPKNLLFNIITSYDAFLVLIDKFVEACGIPHWILLFNVLPFWDSSLILFCSTLNLYMYRFTVDFVITFCIPYTTQILVLISQPETFSSIKNWITLCCLFMVTAVLFCVDMMKVVVK